jgi:hypothetical protein
MKKAVRWDGLLHFIKIALLWLCRVNCFDRANIGTCSAICADLRINYINVAFFNCLNRTFIDTGPASSAIFINYISHD